MASRTETTLLEDFTENEECEKLMKACKDGKVKVVLEQLNKDPKVPMRHENEAGRFETCLEVAVDHGHEDVAEAIVKHKRWKEGLKHKYGDEDRKGDTPFRKLTKKMPDTATKVLDKCVTQPPTDNTFEFDFRFIGEFSYDSDDEPNIGSSDKILASSDRRTFHYKDEHVLEKMKGDILLHPVVRSLLRWKWLKHCAFFFFLALGLYLTFLIFLTAFALTVPNPQLQACIRSKGDDYNQSNSSNTSSISCGVSSGRRGFLISAAVITIICSVVRLFWELVELSHLKRLPQIIFSKRGWTKIHTVIDWKYFLSPNNYIEIPLFVLSIFFVWVFHHECLCPSRGQWQAGFTAVFLAWIDLVLYLDKLPFFGIYIQMLLKIIRNFMKVSVMAILLLFAFCFAFYMAFYEPDLPDTPFQNPGVTFVNMISYAIGSPDNSIFRLSNDDTNVDTIPYPGLSYIIWVIFAIIMSVLFLNLLTGLAVEDVRELRGQAQRTRIKQQIKLSKKTEVWGNRLTAIPWFKSHFQMLDNRDPPNHELSMNGSHLDNIMNYLIGDEIADIVKKASEVQKRKAQWMKSDSGSAQ